MNAKPAMVIVILAVLAASSLIAATSEGAQGAVTVTVDGLEYEIDTGLGTATVSDVVSDKTSWDIPSTIAYNGRSYTVNGIGNFAFSGSNMTEVTIPSSIKDLGKSAFQNCVELETVYFNATSCGNLGQYDRVFNNAGTSGNGIMVIFGPSVTAVPDYLFYVDINNSTRPNVKAVDFSSSRVGSIGESAFSRLGISSVTLPASLVTIEKSAFVNCRLTEITIPEGVKTIGDFAFYNNPATEITIPSTVTSIGDSAFEECRDVTLLNFNAVSCAGFNRYSSGSFDWIGADTSGTQVVFGEGVEKIPAYMFHWPGGSQRTEFNVTSVTIPSTVTSIGSGAFGGCYGLTRIVFSTEEVPTIGSGAFSLGYSGRTVTCNVYSELGKGFLDSGSISNEYTYFIYNGHPNYFTVTFDPNGGSGSQSSVRVKGGTDCSLPSTTTFKAPAGKVFAGWSLSKAGTNLVQTIEGVSKATTVYAVWTDVTYTITYDVGEGSAPAPASGSYKAGSRITLPDYDGIRDGYEFAGWTIGAVNYDVGDPYTIRGDVTAYAIWAPVSQEHKHTLEEVKAVDATCTSEGIIHHWRCTGCGKTFSDSQGMNEIEDVSVPMIDHMLVQISTADEHYLLCQMCGRTFDRGPHVGGTATCMQHAICDVCHQEYGNLGDHDLTFVPAKDPTCKEEGVVAHWVCDVCGKMFSSEDASEEIQDVTVDKVDHVPAAGWKHDDSSHWQVCDVCGVELGKTLHSGGSADCKSLATCTTCGAQYGKFGDHTLTEVEETPAGCVKPGQVHHWVCDVCGMKFSDPYGNNPISVTVIHPAGHKFSGTWVHDDSDHWQVCDVCKAVGLMDEHSGGTASCSSQAKCSVCGSSYGGLDPSNHRGGTSIVGSREPTATEPGYTGDTVCNGCKAVIVRGVEIPATGETTVYFEIRFMVDGEIYRTEEVVQGGYIPTPEDPSKDSTPQFEYEFVGWDGYEPGMQANDDMEFNAVFEESVRQYTIRFVSMGETVSMSILDYGATIVPPEDPIMEGDESVQYIFTGWMGYERGMTVTGDATFVAQFESEGILYDVVFTVDGDIYDEYSLPFGSVVPVPDPPVKDGYSFIGWDGFEPGTTVAGNLTFEAVFEPTVPEYTVTFVVDGDVYEEMRLTEGSVIVLPDDPQLPSFGDVIYEFLGWMGYEPGMTVTGNLTFEAVFEAHDVESSGNDGISEGDDSSTMYIAIAAVIIILIVIAGVVIKKVR